MNISASATIQRERVYVDYSSMEDASLLSRIGTQRDKSALEEIYKRYQAPLSRYLQRGLFEASLVDEVFNDVMFTVWTKASSYRGDSKVSTWIFGIAHFKRLSNSKKELKHVHHTAEDELDRIAIDHDTSALETVQAAMAEISAPHREVVELAYFHGYSMVEIAEIMDCPSNTVKTRLFHARQKLKGILQTDTNFGEAEREQ